MKLARRWRVIGRFSVVGALASFVLAFAGVYAAYELGIWAQLLIAIAIPCAMGMFMGKLAARKVLREYEQHIERPIVIVPSTVRVQCPVCGNVKLADADSPIRLCGHTDGSLCAMEVV